MMCVKNIKSIGRTLCCVFSTALLASDLSGTKSVWQDYVLFANGGHRIGDQVHFFLGFSLPINESLSW